MAYVDYYKILGIDKTATLKDIKAAYRKLARKYHPDLHPDDKDAKKNFQMINEAHEVLSNPEKRKKYDEYGQDWKHADEFSNAKQYQEQYSNSSSSGFSGAQTQGDFSDFFESLFGGSAWTGKSRQVKYRGEDYKAGSLIRATCWLEIPTCIWRSVPTHWPSPPRRAGPVQFPGSCARLRHSVPQVVVPSAPIVRSSPALFLLALQFLGELPRLLQKPLGFHRSLNAVQQNANTRRQLIEKTPGVKP